MRAYVEIRIEAGSNIVSMISLLKSVEGVKEAVAITGHADIMLVVEAQDLNALADLITQKIHAIRGVKSTETMVCVE